MCQRWTEPQEKKNVQKVEDFTVTLWWLQKNNNSNNEKPPIIKKKNIYLHGCNHIIPIGAKLINNLIFHWNICICMEVHVQHMLYRTPGNITTMCCTYDVTDIRIFQQQISNTRTNGY